VYIIQQQCFVAQQFCTCICQHAATTASILIFWLVQGTLAPISNQMRSKFSLAALRQTRRVLICQLAAFSWLAWG
jgi:hypothetical protein